MKSFVAAIAVSAALIPHLCGAAEAPNKALEMAQDAAKASIALLNESGISGVQGAVMRCYAADIKAESRLFCVDLDMAGNHIDAAVSAVTGKERWPFFDKEITHTRVTNNLIKAGVPAAAVDSYTVGVAHLLFPLVDREMGGDDAEASPPPKPKFPFHYDSNAYCRRLGDTAGGSAEVELSCRQQEKAAYEHLSTRPTTPRILNYCNGLGVTSGGSYEVFDACVSQEEAAQRQL